MHRIDEPHPFSLETATLHYAEDRPVIAQHLALELDLDFDKHAITGVATHTLLAVRSLKQLTFDAVDLEIQQGRGRRQGGELRLVLGTLAHRAAPRAIKEDAKFEVRISYRASPQRGLYFIGKTQAWTQGQDIDSRHYFPCLIRPRRSARAK